MYPVKREQKGAQGVPPALAIRPFEKEQNGRDQDSAQRDRSAALVGQAEVKEGSQKWEGLGFLLEGRGRTPFFGSHQQTQIQKQQFGGRPAGLKIPHPVPHRSRRTRSRTHPPQKEPPQCQTTPFQSELGQDPEGTTLTQLLIFISLMDETII